MGPGLAQAGLRFGTNEEALPAALSKADGACWPSMKGQENNRNTAPWSFFLLPGFFCQMPHASTDKRGSWLSVMLTALQTFNPFYSLHFLSFNSIRFKTRLLYFSCALYEV